MGAVEKLIETAKNEVGYLEKKSNSQLESKTANAGSNNYTKYGAYFGHNGPDAYWCDYFVDWCFVQAFGWDKAKDLLVNFSGYTPTSANYYRAKGQYHTSDPLPGDQIFFRNSTRICHTGIVKKVTSSRVYTIEGNTGGGSGVISNGGGVFEKVYDLVNSRIDGYGRPNWKLVEPVKKSGWIEEAGGRRYYQGDTGEYVHNDWHEIEGEWYWHNGAGFPVCDAWKTGRDGNWYYLGPDGRMLRDSWVIWKGELYRVTEDGSMFDGEMHLRTDDQGTLSMV